MKSTDIFHAELKLENTLTEMNLRARQYCQRGAAMSIAAAQDQAAQDFQTFNKDGRFIRLPVRKVKESEYSDFFGIDEAKLK